MLFGFCYWKVDLVLFDGFSSLFVVEQTRNLLRIAIFNISYIRGLFPEKHFNDNSVPALGNLLYLFSNFASKYVWAGEFLWHYEITKQRWRSRNWCLWMLSLVDWLIEWRKAYCFYIFELFFGFTDLFLYLVNIFLDSMALLLFDRCLWCITEKIPEDTFVLCVQDYRWPDDRGAHM
jgi:hypothetical protein